MNRAGRELAPRTTQSRMRLIAALQYSGEPARTPPSQRIKRAASAYGRPPTQLLVDPADLPEGVNAGDPGDLQYVMLMPFTPEGATNLRSLVIAFQDPE